MGGRKIFDQKLAYYYLSPDSQSTAHLYLLNRIIPIYILGWQCPVGLEPSLYHARTFQGREPSIAPAVSRSPRDMPVAKAI